MRGDTKETLALFGILLGMAALASLQVLRAGLQDASRSPYEVILRCVLILTSVVPPELPAQAAVAVHTALLELTKKKVFCTEPYRVPFAGRISVALFDKTGTLTTDQLTAVGAVLDIEPSKATGGAGDTSSSSSSPATLVPIHAVDDAPSAHDAAALNNKDNLKLILAACHSLVAEGKKKKKLAGDPIEVAGILFLHTFFFLP